MAKGVFWILKAKYNFSGIFLGFNPQTAALIFLPKTFSVIIFDRLIGNYYFTLKRLLSEVAYFFIITDMNLCKGLSK
jgi:hypothetical protein